MKEHKVQLGETILKYSESRVKGEFVEIDGEKFYKIYNYDRMPDFFMTVVSDSDQWMFISSNGSLSAGRKNRDHALFPYYTVDKIHDYHDLTGNKTLVIAEIKGHIYLWQPFLKEMGGMYRLERSLCKSVYGNKIIFEEKNLDLGIVFQYGWYNSDKFGFVKKSRIANLDQESVKLEVLDGIRNILPGGVDYSFQNEYSNLLDGYKKSELIKETGLGLFLLSSIPVDRAEPSESLIATTVWSDGLPQSSILISDKQLESFKRGIQVRTETDIRASRGAYFINADIMLGKEQEQEWMTVCEVDQSTTDVANLNHILGSEKEPGELVKEDIRRGTEKLVSIVGAADGLQESNEELSSARHFSNTLFNIMRGGIYINNYNTEVSDFRKFFNQTNTNVLSEVGQLLETLPEEITTQDLIELSEKSDNPDFMRICREYLPLTFSRRHGDPSRPWNLFSIDTRNEDGTPKSDFQGNWRDILQNWEALSHSYPEYIENILAKFVNASTPDGYNPYRIMRSGIEWECPDPNDPWSYIGYWGDHQIIYLQKLLELSRDYHPGKIEELLVRDIFAYANVPYRIKTYSEIVKNPQNTIDFDEKLNEWINSQVRIIGADGRLVLTDGGSVYLVNLTEKILVTLLAKLSNFIPEAGIWLNTQRPEWNDANNALVGNGVSMVTLYYLRRFLSFWHDAFERSSIDSVPISEELKFLYDSIFKLFTENAYLLKTGFSDKERRNLTDALGEAGTEYRESIYKNSFSGNKTNISIHTLVQFTKLALEYIDQSIRKNKREDGLYHSYNLVAFNNGRISIRYLYEMLEGQVAVLSSGYLSAKECLAVLDSLKSSDLFRSDQYSYLLYPDRVLPRFIEKNNVPAKKVKGSKLLSKLLNDNDTSIISMDSSGHYHLNGSFRNAEVLRIALESLDNEKYGSLVNKEKSLILDFYEEMFDHQSFTGRSGTFYAYEGLGSIYWHMVSKLLLASQECFFKAIEEGLDAGLIGRFKDHYYEIKAGIGLYKPPELYGAFPIDPYSHTPGNAGAKQPGMTGQVKEDFISRMKELGVKIEKGRIVFDTAMLKEAEFLSRESSFNYKTLDGNNKIISLLNNQLAFTVCQVPVVYTLSDKEDISVILKEGKVINVNGNSLDNEISNQIFQRIGDIEQLNISVSLLN